MDPTVKAPYFTDRDLSKPILTSNVIPINKTYFSNRFLALHTCDTTAPMTSLRCLTRCLKCHPKVRLSPHNNRNFSFYGAVQSLAETQAAFFKTLSESAPVGHFQNMLLNVHEYSGLPWWVTIVGTTVALRTAITLPLAIHQHYILAKVENLNVEMGEIVGELKKEMAVAVALYKWDERTAKRHYRRAVIKFIFLKKKTVFYIHTLLVKKAME